MLSGAVCPVTAAIAATGVMASAFALFKSKEKPTAKAFALTSAAVFGLQMLNYPIWSGVSGHLIGGVFAAAILGTPAAILSLALVLLIQTLMFADGGILMLGANIVNMGLIGAGLGGLIFSKLKDSGYKRALFIAGAISVFSATLAVSAELLASGKCGFSVIATLLGVHAVLALIEGTATLGLVQILKHSENQTAEVSGKFILGLSVIVLLSLCVAPFASVFPDAFEWTMSYFNILPDAPNFVNAPFSDYAVSFISNEILSGVVASVIGVVATIVFAYALMLPFEKSKA